MRTTIHLDENLLAELKRIAASSGRTLTSVIHDAIRESLARRGRTNPPKADLPVVHGTGLQPGVDLHDSASLLDHMDSADGPA
jgi:Arc/MetJ family transcription regulator